MFVNKPRRNPSVTTILVISHPVFIKTGTRYIVIVTQITAKMKMMM
jgi:hypothetical protein